MICTCNCLSPFRWAEFRQPSAVLRDRDMNRGAGTGKTMSQIRSEGVTREMERTGRSPGSVFGISAHSDRLIEQGNYERAKRRAA